MKLWLDDQRDPAEHGYIGWHWAKDYDEAVAALKTGEVTECSLDHDLSVSASLGYYQNELTGYDVICWMERNGVWPKDGVRVHSMNPVGRARMQQVIDRWAETPKEGM